MFCVYVYIIVLFLQFSINLTGLLLVSYLFIIFSNRGDVWKPGNPLLKAIVKGSLYIVNSALREREQSQQSRLWRADDFSFSLRATLPVDAFLCSARKST